MKGPKGMLAQAIANALAEYFIVDQTAMETRLLSDAAITLKNTRLKPQHIVVSPLLVADITGIVESVSFEWHWGHSEKGGSDWVKDAKLTIAGLKLAAVLSDHTSGEEKSSSSSSSSSVDNSEDVKKKAAEAKGLMAYIQNQVEALMDELTLTLTDFEFSVTLPNGQSLVAGGTGMDLISMGRVDTQPLEQRVAMGSIFCNILVDDELYPVLEPIGYKATCIRTHGHRFSGGIDTGVQVMGESSDAGIVVHTGMEQIMFFNDLVGLVLLASPQPQPADPEEQGKEIRLVEGEKLAVEEETKNVEKALSVSSGLADVSSIFELPLSAVSLVFPNETKVSLSGLVLKYQMDGSVLKVEGRNGILVNDFQFLSLGKTCLWCADMLTSKFSFYNTAVDMAASKDIVAFVSARDEEIQRVKTGMNLILATVRGLDDGAVAAVANSEKPVAPPPKPTDATTPSWDIELHGQVGCLYEGPDSDVVAELIMRDVHAKVDTMEVTIAAVEKLYLPGSLKLREPILNSSFQFDGSVFDVKIGDIVATLEEVVEEDLPITPENIPEAEHSKAFAGERTSTVSTDSEPDSIEAPFVLPFGVVAAIDQIIIYKPEGDELHTTVKKFQLAMGPNSTPGPDSDDVGGIRAALMFDKIDHDLISLEEPKFSALIHLQDLTSIPQFRFQAKRVAVAAGYTALDWKRMYDPFRREKNKILKKKHHKHPKKKDAPTKPLRLPGSHIEPLKIKVVVKGDVVGFKESTLHVGAFDGNDLTTTEDLAKFYGHRLATKFPNMILNAEFLGMNASENVVGHFASATGNTVLSSLGAAAGPVGGVLGIAAFDGVRNTIKAGKADRGAESDDKTHILDFARGLKAAAVDATRGGAKARGKRDDQMGDPLDWAIGATTNVASYTNENKSRLGAAGAGTAGFAYGMVIGGPVGAIAGAVIASAVTGKTIDKVAGKKKKKKKDEESDEKENNTKTSTSSQKIKSSVKSQDKAVEEKKEDDMVAAKSVETNLSEHPVPLRGILLKRRDHFQWDWRSHYFVLEGHALKYYDFHPTPSPSDFDAPGKQADDVMDQLFKDASLRPRKSLALKDRLVEKADDLSNPEEHLFVFVIKSSSTGNEWILGTASEETRQNWIDRLGAACADATDD